MDDTTGFDPVAYHRAPSLTAGTAISLIDALTQTHPKEAPPLAKKTLKKLQELKGRITAELAARRKVDAPERPPAEIDGIADNAWRALRGYLGAYQQLQPQFAPLQAEARKLEEVLFGNGGLAFTNFTYPEQRAEMHHRIDALEQGDHLKVLQAIVGEACEKNLRVAVADYDTMVMGLLQNTSNEDAKLTPMVREIQKGVVDYARFIAATVDEEDPETAVAALRALAPIDNLRRMTATPRAAAPKETPPPATPAPPQEKTPG
jgi:hypothetical protein